MSNQATTYTVAFEGPNWTFFRDGEVPDGWTVWSTGLSWEEAHDAVSRSDDSLPILVAFSHDLSHALDDAGCISPNDFSLVLMPGVYGDCIIIHSQKAFNVWFHHPLIKLLAEENGKRVSIKNPLPI